MILKAYAAVMAVATVIFLVMGARFLSMAALAAGLGGVGMVWIVRYLRPMSDSPSKAGLGVGMLIAATIPALGKIADVTGGFSW